MSKRPDNSLKALAGRIGGFTTHSRNDSRAVTAPARAAFMARFDDEVDPERKLQIGERSRRAEYARKAYFARLAMKSATARRARKASGDE